MPLMRKTKLQGATSHPTKLFRVVRHKCFRARFIILADRLPAGLSTFSTLVDDARRHGDGDYSAWTVPKSSLPEERDIPRVWLYRIFLLKWKNPRPPPCAWRLLRVDHFANPTMRLSASLSRSRMTIICEIHSAPGISIHFNACSYTDRIVIPFYCAHRLYIIPSTLFRACQCYLLRHVAIQRART